jgi:hypothetical protein
MALRAIGRDADAVALLRTVRADHPAHAAYADGELCELLPAGDELKEARERLGDLAPMRARLLCDGMPPLPGPDPRVAAHEGLVAYVFVTSHDPESERRLAELPEAGPKLLPVVVCVDEEPDLHWLSDHARELPTIARGAAVRQRLGGVPSTVVARKDGSVVAIDPDAEELARLAGG